MVAQVRNRQLVTRSFSARGATGRQVVAIFEPQDECLLSLGVVGESAEILKLPANLLCPATCRMAEEREVRPRFPRLVGRRGSGRLARHGNTSAATGLGGVFDTLKRNSRVSASLPINLTGVKTGVH